MCVRPQRGAFSRVLHAYTVASENRCLPQSEAFSAYFAGRHSIPDLRDTKLTEGEAEASLGLFHHLHFSIFNGHRLCRLQS